MEVKTKLDISDKTYQFYTIPLRGDFWESNHKRNLRFILKGGRDVVTYLNDRGAIVSKRTEDFTKNNFKVVLSRHDEKILFLRDLVLKQYRIN